MTDEPTDRTAELYLTHAELMSDNCLVILTAVQTERLRQFLDEIRAMGPGMNFRLERCIDHHPGHAVDWDNDGTREQDDRVDDMIRELCEDLGFYG